MNSSDSILMKGQRTRVVRVDGLTLWIAQDT
jgi:hypothetical protein